MAATAPRAASGYLIWGKGGWIAGQMEELLLRQGHRVHCTRTDMEDQVETRKELDGFNPSHVINCAGKTGRPTVDWCESHKIETLESNVTGTLMLAMECHRRGIHLTVLATGCIYESTYNEDHTVAISKPFKETDPANFGGSFYSYTKSRVEDVLINYPNVCILRLRMPVSDDLHPRSFVTKIKGYKKVVSIPNSHSILHDLLPVAIAMADHNETGVYNFTNPGSISHNEVLMCYKQYVDPSFAWENFTVEEQSKILAAGRSNCELDTSKLMAKVKQYQGEGYELTVPEIHESYEQVFKRMTLDQQQKEGAAHRTTA